MPLTAPLEENEAYTIKFCRDESFKNTCHHVASKSEYINANAPVGERCSSTRGNQRQYSGRSYGTEPETRP